MNKKLIDAEIDIIMQECPDHVVTDALERIAAQCDRRCDNCDYWRKGDVSGSKPADRWGLCTHYSTKAGDRPALMNRLKVLHDSRHAGPMDEVRVETFQDFGCDGWWEKDTIPNRLTGNELKSVLESNQ